MRALGKLGGWCLVGCAAWLLYRDRHARGVAREVDRLYAQAAASTFHGDPYREPEPGEQVAGVTDRVGPLPEGMIDMSGQHVASGSAATTTG